MLPFKGCSYLLLPWPANLFGSQADGIRVDQNDGSGSGSGWSLDANFDFQSLGRYTDFGYEVEFIVPFNSIP